MDYLRKEIRTAPKKLSQAYADFLQFVRQNPQALIRENFLHLESLKHDFSHIQAWPALTNRTIQSELATASIEVLKLIKSIPTRIFNFNMEKMSQFYEVPLHEIQKAFEGTTQAHIDQFIARGDWAFSPTTGLKCIEYNISGGIGGMRLDVLKNLYLENPIIKQFLQHRPTQFLNISLVESLLKYLLNILTPSFPKFNNQINITFAMDEVTDRHIHLKGLNELIQSSLTEILKKPFNGHSITAEVFISSFNDLNVQNGYVTLQNKPIAMIVDMTHGTTLPEAFFQVFKNGNLHLINTPITPMISSKANLALLSEHENSPIFTAYEQNIIKKHIPWTRKIIPGKTTYQDTEINLEEFLIANRPHMVIKPAVGMEGDDVYVGKHIPELQWNGLVQLALKDRIHIAQEYINPHVYVFQSGENGCTERRTVWASFIFGETYASGFLRMIDSQTDNSGVINAYKGAEVCPIFEVDEEF